MTTMDVAQDELLTRDEVLSRLKCARSTLYVLMNEEGLPRPLKLGGRDNRWLRSELDAWLENRIAMRST